MKKQYFFWKSCTVGLKAGISTAFQLETRSPQFGDILIVGPYIYS